MRVKLRLPFMAALILTTGCSDRVESPSDPFLIPKERVASVIEDANRGDLSAVKQLIAHFEASSGNDAIAAKWSAKARELGDAQELYYYAAQMFTATRHESNSLKKHEMLVDALNSAKRSYAIRADTSTQELVDEIAQALDGGENLSR